MTEETPNEWYVVCQHNGRTVWVDHATYEEAMSDARVTRMENPGLRVMIFRLVNDLGSDGLVEDYEELYDGFVDHSLF